VFDSVPVADVRRFEAELLDDLHRNAGSVYEAIKGGKALDDASIATLTAATKKFKAGFLASDGSRVVNEAEAEALDASEVGQEKVTVKRTTVSK
jgi:F-type H+-transporting ATPase subunit alpha